VSCGVGHRLGSDLVLLWLWCRPAAIAPIRPLAWKPPYAADVAIIKEKEKEKERNNTLPFPVTTLHSFLKAAVFYSCENHLAFIFLKSDILLNIFFKLCPLLLEL